MLFNTLNKSINLSGDLFDRNNKEFDYIEFFIFI